ncbi:DUF6039 family protein [Streptomyces sp. NPDC048491]|uniref:DUF6039 family protein n=1 Tax=Streptomyces sp. NPDC048491 TaxID=3157207 RepID=UPI00341E3507
MHFLIHMQSLSTMYALMGIDARTDPSSPRATYMQDWVSTEKDGGRWDRMIVEGGGRGSALTPQYWGG